jgi:hypothetical protein
MIYVHTSKPHKNQAAKCPLKPGVSGREGQHTGTSVEVHAALLCLSFLPTRYDWQHMQACQITSRSRSYDTHAA